MTPRAYKRRLRRTARRTEAPPDYSAWAQECSGWGCPCCDPGKIADKGCSPVGDGRTVGEDAYWWRRWAYEATRNARRAVAQWQVKPWTAYPIGEELE